MSSVTPAPERRRAVRALFEAALERMESERAAFVAAHDGGDRTLRAEVEALLAAHLTGDGFLDPPAGAAAAVAAAVRSAGDAAGDAAGAPGAAGAADVAGRRVGPYALVRRIGAGGMGTVYEAVRADDAFERRVAVKFVRRTLADPAAHRRFQAERQFLADLAHPHIAALLDGGTTPDGEPYLVMELVAGAPITAWCDVRRLGVDARLRLFLQVCAAVAAAHQRLVVHRDLKPGNVLVADDGTVKLLDFGIAKLLDDAALAPGGDAHATATGLRAFTPGYAAPEQVRGEPARTTADVYALGVLLHELLTGAVPLAEQLAAAGGSLMELERVVSTVPPPPPSTCVDAARAGLLGERGVARARARLSGDLDAIVGMALRKEPERRYASVEALGRDVRLHLDGQPVSARPDGLAYRVGKLVRRRRVETALAALVLASLVGGLVVSTVQRGRAESARAVADSARRVAEGERRKAEAVTSFLTTMLGSADPRARGRDVTVREVLDSAAAQADTLARTPELEAAVRSVIGATYIELGQYDAAVRQLERDVAARQRATPAGDFALGSAISRLALAHEQAGRFVVADSLLRRSAAVFAVHPPPDPVEHASALEDRARVLVALGRAPDARRLLDEAIAVQRRGGAPIDSMIAYTYGNAASAASDANDQAAADTLLRLGEASARRAFGDAHPLVASLTAMHAVVFERTARLREADSTYRVAVALRARVLGPDHPNTLWAIANHADHLVVAERWREAAGRAREVLAWRGRTLDDGHPAVGTALGVLARALARLDSGAAAVALAREAVRVRRAAFPADHWVIAAAENTLGEVLALDGALAEAERLLLDSERRLFASRGLASESVERARARLAMLYERRGRPADAARWRAARDSSRAART